MVTFQLLVLQVCKAPAKRYVLNSNGLSHFGLLLNCRLVFLFCILWSGLAAVPFIERMQSVLLCCAFLRERRNPMIIIVTFLHRFLQINHAQQIGGTVGANFNYHSCSVRLKTKAHDFGQNLSASQLKSACTLHKLDGKYDLEGAKIRPRKRFQSSIADVCLAMIHTGEK